MKSLAKILCLLLIIAGSAISAQLYRWVDSKGNVEWRDTPPPASVPSKNIQQRRVGDNVIGTSEAPYSLQLATKNHPVTFWDSSDCGKICEVARTHLARRGVPFAEKNPRTDMEGFKKVSPASEIPVLQVGSMVLKGYLESEWDNTLDSAGYPRTAVATRPKPAAAPAAANPAADGAKPTAEGAKPADTTMAPPVAAK